MRHFVPRYASSRPASLRSRCRGNEFIYALTFISSSESKTVPVGVITELVEGDVYHWGSLMAGALLGSLPSLWPDNKVKALNAAALGPPASDRP
jgi:hypothetical protein